MVQQAQVALPSFGAALMSVTKTSEGSPLASL
jgi:hypothetical protein